MLRTLFARLNVCRRWPVTASTEPILLASFRTLLQALKHIRSVSPRSPLRLARHRTLPAPEDALRAAFFQGCSNSSCLKALFG